MQLSKLDKQHHKRLKEEVKAAAAEQAERDSRAFVAAQKRYGELETRAEEYERKVRAQAEIDKQEHEAEMARMADLAKEEQERFDAAERELKKEVERLEEEKRKVPYSTHVCTLDSKSYNTCMKCFDFIPKRGYFYRKLGSIICVQPLSVTMLCACYEILTAYVDCCFCDNDRYALCLPCWINAPYGSKCRDTDHPSMKRRYGSLNR